MRNTVHIRPSNRYDILRILCIELLKNILSQSYVSSMLRVGLSESRHNTRKEKIRRKFCVFSSDQQSVVSTGGHTHTHTRTNTRGPNYERIRVCVVKHGSIAVEDGRLH